MGESKTERISIQKLSESPDGKMITYMKSRPLNLDTDFTEIVMSSLRSYWLPLSIFSQGETGSGLKQTGIWAIAQLESQISIIRQICGIENPGAAHSLIIPMGQAQSLPQQSPQIKREELAIEHKTAEDEDETDENKDKDEDEDDFLDLELTEQMSKNLKRFGGS
ncbi:hypothetical protein [Nostoc sp. MG11]|uniref:hypothetical protein n=1 Tax=Nostoc sp. MG11 TaxID=2721166 RepID=UPI00186898BF|nr:hypothetical protein [Nostoc sp. MG11]